MAASKKPTMSKHKLMFIAKYQEMLDWIRPEHFAHFYEQVPDHRSIDVYKEGLLSSIVSYLNTIWDSTNTDEHLDVMGMMKADQKHDSSEKWRPTGKSAKEQVRPLMVNKLKWQKKMYEKQIHYQKQQLEQAVKQVELNRKRWTELRKRRAFMINAITSELQDFKTIESQMTDIEDKVIQDFQQ